MYAQTQDRIVTNPMIMGGKPCIRGMRVTVDMVVTALNSGTTAQELLADFPYLQNADIEAARIYVHEQREQL
ncbi:MAG: DUF433 domain-containing protein [Candidatus Symbiobacter sp.]|nr:DUF433 domain-containing protein [Candidatus Symbiobacter sp.]